MPNDVVPTFQHLSVAMAQAADAAAGVAGKANIASPTFTGTPNAPTASPGTISNQIATCAFVSGAVTGYAPLNNPTFTGAVAGITKAMVGLGNVDNTSDANKPVSTAQQTALDLKAPLASPSFTGTVAGITKAMVGLSNVDNTPDSTKPVSTATQAALDLKAPLTSPVLTGTPTAPTAANGTNTTQVATCAFVLANGGGGGGANSLVYNVQALTSNPTEAQTIYFGHTPAAPTTTAALRKIYFRKAGTIKFAEIYSHSGTAGTAEAWTLSIRKNNTTDTAIATVSAATAERVWTNSALNIEVAAGDYIEIKSVNPTWATNPATTIFGGYLIVE